MRTDHRSFQQALFDRSLRWIVSHENRLLRHSSKESNLRHVIRMAELTMTAGVLLRYSSICLQSEPGRIARRWISKAWQSLRWGESIIRAIEGEDGGAILAASYVPFAAVGQRNLRVEKALMAALPCRENDPISRMYAQAALAQLSLGSRRAAVASFDHWWKMAKSVPANMAAYAVTHAAFAFTDLMKKPHGCPPKLRQAIRAHFPKWHISAMRTGNWDLLAELLMASHCIDHKCAERRIWKVLAKAQRKDGAMASARTGLKLAYHPTFAVLMAAGLCLQTHAEVAAT